MSGNWPKVSVVISTYNRPEKLDLALASVHAQTFDDFEVVVVDDFSPRQEEVMGVLEKWHARFAERGVKLWPWRLGENSGYQCMPKNKGIEKSSGDYIAYLDDDNTWWPEHLAECVKAIEHKDDGSPNFSVDMVYTRLRYHADEETASKHPELPLGDAEGQEWQPQILSQRNYIDTSTILHSKGAFWRMVRETGYGWDEVLRRFGDWNFVWRWALVGNNAKLVDKVTVNYNWSLSSLQLSRPVLEVPVCLSFEQYQQYGKQIRAL